MTVFGINPSVSNWTSRLPLFSNPLLQAKKFEVFDEAGLPTGKDSELGPDGWPKDDGVTYNGVRLYGDMEGTMPAFSKKALDCKEYRLKINPGNSAFLSWKTRPSQGALDLLTHDESFFYANIASLKAIKSLPHTVIRTLDWQMANKVQDLSKTPIFQGSDLGMSVEYQAKFVKLLNGHMWWTAPPRYDTPVEVYKEQIRSRLVTIKNTLDTPIILEYGNELWNSDFPVHHTLTPKWYVKAAKEISILKDVADSVFGKTPVFGKKPYYLFAGSHFQQIDTTALIITELDTLGITPDIVGPAFYVGPKREDVLFWQERGTVPTQADLQHSCYARLTEMKTKLFEHVQIVRSFGVEYAGLYECGQSFIAKGHPWREAAITAQPTTWLGNLMQATREVIHQQGVDVACWYSAASSQTPDNKQLDVFGFLEGVGKPVMPKAYAIMDKI